MNIKDIKEIAKTAKWGFLREDQIDVEKAGIDYYIGLKRTSLLDYLKVIFPNTTDEDWIHDKKIPKTNWNVRPDYRNKALKLLVEFDGLPHYENVNTIIKDKIKTKYYQKLGYKVVRIPYFIQLTKRAVKTLFDVDINEELFNEQIPSLNIGRGSPASICGAGLKRMAEEFKKFPEQYKVNIDFLEELKFEDLEKTQIEWLEEKFKNINLEEINFKELSGVENLKVLYNTIE